MTDPAKKHDVPPQPQAPQADPPPRAEHHDLMAPTVEGLEARIAELEKQIEQLKNERLMALAEAENAAKRADRRIAENAKFATANICKTLLQVADNLGRALLAAPAEQRAGNEALKNLAVGVELTEKELMKVLEDQGVKRVAALNQPFDANLHNAVQEVENTTVPAGTVVQVLIEGYTMHDRLLRPAMVIVSRGGPKREAAKPDAASAPGVDTTA
jgi:molecular chaperone GrpE